jgi:hypothetical protein
LFTWHYERHRAALIEKLSQSKTVHDKRCAISALMENADIGGNKEEVVHWCKELLKLYGEDEIWKPMPREATKIIQDYGG